jgi:hypothetical protein
MPKITVRRKRDKKTGDWWVIYEPSDRAPNRSQPANYGTNSLIVKVPVHVALNARLSTYHGRACGDCAGFTGCAKAPSRAQDYCAFPFPSRFRAKGTI